MDSTKLSPAHFFFARSSGQFKITSRVTRFDTPLSFVERQTGRAINALSMDPRFEISSLRTRPFLPTLQG